MENRSVIVNNKVSDSGTHASCLYAVLSCVLQWSNSTIQRKGSPAHISIQSDDDNVNTREDGGSCSAGVDKDISDSGKFI